MNRANASRFSRRKLRLLVVSLVLVLSIVFTLIAHPFHPGEVTLTLASITPLENGEYEATFIVRNGRGRSVACTDSLIVARAPFSSGGAEPNPFVPYSNRVKPGTEIEVKATFNPDTSWPRLAGCIWFIEAPSMWDRLNRALPEWIKFWQNPSVITWSSMELVESAPFTAADWSPAEAVSSAP